MLTITNVQAFLTQPQGPHARLVVVKVTTNQPGLFGLGCATFTQRHRAVEAAVRHHLGPFVTGKDPRNIEDLWHSMMYSAYWRNGPVLNNAISGIDMALWDIKGKLANMPCYQLWGGRCRQAVTVYRHADGKTPQQVAENAAKFMEQGFTHIRCQLGGYAGTRAKAQTDDSLRGVYYAPKEKLIHVPPMFEYVRKTLGPEVELLYDVHERMAPTDAVALAKALEPFRLFFLEDVLAPEDLEWLAMFRQHSAIPLAIGELFNSPHEIIPFASRRLFDFLRVHPSQMGGITPCLKLANLCAAYGIRTAWHGPGDVSAVGMAANVHMDLALHNFGIQEWGARNQAEQDMFPGIPQLRDGMAWANDKPGMGIDFDETVAAKFPCDEKDLEWTTARWPDGTVWPP